MELTSISVPPSLETVLTPPTHTPNDAATATPPKELSPAHEVPTTEPPLRPALQNSIKIKGLTASWSDNEEMPTLKDISLEVNEVSGANLTHTSLYIVNDWDLIIWDKHGVWGELAVTVLVSNII